MDGHTANIKSFLLRCLIHRKSANCFLSKNNKRLRHQVCVIFHGVSTAKNITLGNCEEITHVSKNYKVLITLIVFNIKGS